MEIGPGEKAAQIIMPALNFLLTGPLRKYRPIQDVTVAKAMINAARQDKPGIHIYPSDEIEKLGNK